MATEHSAAAEAETGRRPRKALPKKRKKAKQGGKTSAGADDDANIPGMLLTDLVDGSQELPLKVVKQLKRPLRRPRKRREDAAGEPGAESSDAEQDGEASERLLGTIGRLGAATKEKTSSVAAQVRPESEFHAGIASEAVSLEDVLAPLAEAPGFGDVRKQLEGLSRSEPLQEAANDIKRSREERDTQYQKTKQDIGKWIPQVQRMRKADQVVLGEGENINSLQSTGSLVGHFHATDDFEKELEQITRAAGSTEEDIKGAKVLPMNPRIRDEKQVQQIAKLKALMLREQQSSKRIKKIKSKTYRRIHRKAEGREREVLLERLEHENPELAKALKQDYEKKHAELRLRRQRNARQKWAQTMQRFAKGDKNASREISKQAQSAHDEERALRRAIQGKNPDASEESDAVDLSDVDSDEGAGRQGLVRQTLAKAGKLTVGEIKSLEKGGDLPSTGLLGMNFMRDAIQRKRESAKAEAQSVLKELDGLGRSLERSDDDTDDEATDDGGKEGREKPAAAGTGAAAGELTKPNRARSFTPEELAAARKEVDDLFAQEDAAVACSVSGPLTIRPSPAQLQATALGSRSAPSSGKHPAATSSSMEATVAPATKEASAENPWLDTLDPEAVGTTATTSAGKGLSDATTSEQLRSGAEVSCQAGLRRAGKKKRKARAGTEEAQKAAAAPMEEVLNVFNADSESAREQRDLVRTAFVEGDQAEDFDEEQEELARKKGEAEDQARKAQELAGWGSWTGEGIKARTPAQKRGREQLEGGSDKKRARVQILEGKSDAGSGKYFVDKVPFPFQTPEQYDQQMRMPTGREWNSLSTHLQRVKPKMFVKVGAIVPPLQYVKHLPPEQRDDAIKTWSSAKQPKRLGARF